MMLPPHELRTKKFSKSFHGYSPDEVDDQIAFLLEQYTNLYRENDDLERKLKMAQAQLDSYQTDEESIRSALVGAQKAGDKIVQDANERAEMLMKAAKETTDRMVSETAVRIREQMRILQKLRIQAKTLKETLLAQYAQQIALIEQTAENEQDAGLEDLADEELVRAIIAGIKDEAARMTQDAPAPIKRKPRSGTIWNKSKAASALSSLSTEESSRIPDAPSKLHAADSDPISVPEAPAEALPALPEPAIPDGEPEQTEESLDRVSE